MMSDGETVEFLTEGGVGVIHYGELKAWDAEGKELPASMHLAKASGPSDIRHSEFVIRIRVDASDAVYPVTIDPLATLADWTAESDQEWALFGHSVSTAGDVNGDGYSDVIVGAPEYDNGELAEGRAFVYHGSAFGLSATAAWTAESDQEWTLFGVSVSTAGDVNGDGYSDVIVGANFYENGELSEGGAFVYHGSASGLSATANWTGEGNQPGAQFGGSVSTAGDVNGDGYSDVIVGANFYENGELSEGGAFVYHGSASGLSATANWTGEANEPGAAFGGSVSTAGDVNGDGYSDVIVGADAYDNGETDEGRAYVYHGSASGLSDSPAWTAEGDQESAHFGYSVSTAGDVNADGYSDVIVGAYLYDNGNLDEGRAFVYHGSASGLSASAAWTAESHQVNAQFGSSVSTAGDVNGDGYADVIVGAPFYDNGNLNEGRAFMYHGSMSGLSATAAWTAESDQSGARFGHSVSTAGDVNGDGYADVIIGAIYYRHGEKYEGRAFVYYGLPSERDSSAAWSEESDALSVQFGQSVATAGDVNGDGYGDVIVGAPLYDGSSPEEGRAYAYYGSAWGLSTAADWVASTLEAYGWSGRSVSTAGDVNGDGYADVVVTDVNRAVVYHGSATGISSVPAWARLETSPCACGAGDVNGDGYADVIVGAPFYDNGETDEGQALVYHGSASGLSATPAWAAEGNQAEAYFGGSVATAGDVNGDGYADVIVGARGYDNEDTDEGRVYVYQGSPTGLSSSPSWTAEGNQANAYFGLSVSTAGDVNGDGFADVIAGAPNYDDSETDEGRVYVYHGSASGLSSSPSWTAESGQATSYFGNSVAAAGDVNSDGYADVVVGAWNYDNGETDEGRVLIYEGSASGLCGAPCWVMDSDQTEACFGTSVCTAGDVNGDGYADVIIGAPYYDNGEIDEGGAFVYYINGGLSLSTAIRLERWKTYR
jgi:hypothetical protein